MSWVDVDKGAGRGVLPPIPRLLAREYKHMLAILVEDGQFEIAVERSA